MDIGLPDTDGYELTKRIRLRELTKGTHVPIIALSAHVDVENNRHCIEVGMNAVLTKPLLKDKATDILDAFIPTRKIPKKEAEKLEKEKQADQTITGKVFDLEAAKKTLGNEKLIDEMLGLLIRSFPEEIEKIEKAHAKSNWNGIGALAHKLKGGASYCGTVRLKEACGQLDTYIKSGEKDAGLLEKLHKQMMDEIHAVEEFMKNKK